MSKGAGGALLHWPFFASGAQLEFPEAGVDAPLTECRLARYMEGETRMPKQRRLTDLYVVGKEVSISDGYGEPVVVWVQKLNPVDHETALRRANAARARTFALRHDADSPDLAALQLELDDMELEELVVYLLAEEEAKIRGPIEAELGAEDEWADNNYLQGLFDSWGEGLSRTYAENPEDPEARNVFGELTRFNERVEELTRDNLAATRRDLEELPEAKLRDDVLQRMINVRADLAWLQEYRRCEVWLSTREPANHKARYFESREEIDDLANEVLAALSQSYRSLTVDPVEGKGSEVTASSSDSSGPSAEQEMEPSSGQGGAAA